MVHFWLPSPSRGSLATPSEAAFCRLGLRSVVVTYDYVNYVQYMCLYALVVRVPYLGTCTTTNSTIVKIFD